MKKKVFGIISLVLVAVLIVVSIISVVAETISIYNGYSFTTLDGDYISICGWDNSSETLTIPAQLDGSYVREVANLGLSYNTYITSLNLAPAIYMNRIGTMAFRGCTGLTGTISIPYRISEIGLGAFQECSSITSVEYYTDIAVADQCFNKCTSLEDVHIADGVQYIGKLAFANCPNLVKVRIPSSVSEINSSAFKYDDNLVIYCYTDSYAQQYAEDNGIEYVLIDGLTEPTVPTEPVTEEPTQPETQPATEEPTDATQPATEAPVLEHYLLGDTDGDGTIDVVDATFAQRYATNVSVPISDAEIMRADVDSDGEVTAVDATYIMRHCIFMTVPYPIDEMV